MLQREGDGFLPENWWTDGSTEVRYVSEFSSDYSCFKALITDTKEIALKTLKRHSKQIKLFSNASNFILQSWTHPKTNLKARTYWLVDQSSRSIPLESHLFYLAIQPKHTQQPWEPYPNCSYFLFTTSLCPGMQCASRLLKEVD